MARKPVDFVKAQQETTKPAKEVVEHLYNILLATPEFTLRDGSKARVERYIAPEVDDAGEVQCGFDVKLENGSHLEFMLRNTGWGKSFTDGLAKKPGKKDRPR